MSLVHTRTPSKGAARLVLAVLAAAGLLVPSAATATHEDRTLDIALESGSGAAGSAMTIELTLSEAAAADVVVNVEIVGPNDSDGGDSPESPDKTCTIAAAATTCTEAVAYTPGSAGVDTFKAWIADATLDATEAANEEQEPGATEEPDATDVVFRVVKPNPEVLPKGVECKNAALEFPLTEQSLKPNAGAGSVETYTCTAKFITTGTPAINTVIDSENMTLGVNDTDGFGGTPDFTCTTAGADASCTISIPSQAPELALDEGTAFICFWVDDDGDDGVSATDVADGGACPERFDVGETGADPDIPSTDVVALTWEVPVPTSLDITPEDPSSIDLQATQQTTVPVTLKDQFGTNMEAGSIDFKVLGGPNRTVDDEMQFECTIEAGTCSGTLAATEFHFNGTDKVCAWLDADFDNEYVLGGDPEDGGECVDEPAGPGTDDGGLTDRGQVVWANGFPAPTSLDLSPETGSASATSARTFTAVVKDEQQNLMGGVHINFEVTGAGDLDGDAPDDPDYSCDVPSVTPPATPTGQCSVAISSNATGDALIRAWVDFDEDDDATADGDADMAEGRDEALEPGAEELDTTDVVTVKWVATATSVTIRPAVWSVIYSKATTLSGTLTKSGGVPLAGRQVVVQRRLVGSTVFTSVANATTDANGRWAWAVKPTVSADYRASFGGSPPVLLASVSAPVRLTVRVLVSIAASTRTPRVTNSVAFTGKVLPAHYGKRVYLQVRQPNGSWKSVATALCDRYGAYRMSYRRNTAGGLVFRVYFPPQDSDHGLNVSPNLYVRWS